MRIFTLLRGGLWLWRTWGDHLIRRASLNGERQTSSPGVFPQPWPSDKNHTETCKNLHTPSTPHCQPFQTQQPEGSEGERGEQKEETKVELATKNSLPFASSASGLGSAERDGCSHHFFCMWASTCAKNTRACLSFWYVYAIRSKCVGSSQEIYTYCVHI